MRDAARYERDFALRAGTLELEAGLHIVQRVYDQVAVADEVVGVGVAYAHGKALHIAHCALRDVSRDCHGFVDAEGRGVAVQLSVEVALLENVAVAEFEPAYAEAEEQLRTVSAQTAAPRDEHGLVAQDELLLLRYRADIPSFGFSVGHLFPLNQNIIHSGHPFCQYAPVSGCLRSGISLLKRAKAYDIIMICLLVCASHDSRTRT